MCASLDTLHTKCIPLRHPHTLETFYDPLLQANLPQPHSQEPVNHPIHLYHNHSRDLPHSDSHSM